jgi:hypothetical protein
MTVEQKLDLVSDSVTLGTTRNLLRVRKAADSLVVEIRTTAAWRRVLFRPLWIANAHKLGVIQRPTRGESRISWRLFAAETQMPARGSSSLI